LYKSFIVCLPSALNFIIIFFKGIFMSKKILCLSVFLFLNLAHAETCPTKDDIKNNSLHQWQAVDLDNAEPLSPAELKKFEKKVDSFAFAAWMPDAPEGSGHCYYNGKQPDESYLEVFLTKATGEPDKSVGKWTQDDPEFMKCEESDVGLCRFLD
jgi:hypothetical protein